MCFYGRKWLIFAGMINTETNTNVTINSALTCVLCTSLPQAQLEKNVKKKTFSPQAQHIVTSTSLL